MTDWVSRLALIRAAYFGLGAGLQVRDLVSGNVVYREVLALVDTMPGDGRLVWIGAKPDSIEGEEQDASS
jgi:hypothetical protein